VDGARVAGDGLRAVYRIGPQFIDAALPVQLVLPTHGGPIDRAALERALA
jgi:hypothetical protein